MLFPLFAVLLVFTASYSGRIPPMLATAVTSDVAMSTVCYRAAIVRNNIRSYKFCCNASGGGIGANGSRGIRTIRSTSIIDNAVANLGPGAACCMEKCTVGRGNRTFASLVSMGALRRDPSTNSGLPPNVGGWAGLSREVYAVQNTSQAHHPH